MTLPPPEPVCGALIRIPAARCTLPPNHAPPHLTAEIPEVLSGVAAEMLMEGSRLSRAVEEYQLRARAARVALFLFLGAGVGFVGMSVIMLGHLLSVH